MIVVTGAAGFIGSNVVADLEAAGRGPIAVCDWFGTGDKWRNLAKRRIAAFVRPDALLPFLDAHRAAVRAVIHMGAISATTETDVDRLIELNIDATVRLFDWCAENGTAFVYASSAATYGAREEHLLDDDSPEALGALRPLNAYGWSKKATDDILAARSASGGRTPPQWIGLKFFNVYGPNEYHKGDMKSVVAKLFEPVRDGRPVRLFRSDREGVADGQQRRDFVYVKDCTRTILWLLDRPAISGIFNLGTAEARSFADLAAGLGFALEREARVEFIDMPDALKGKYQYVTQADMGRLRGLGLPFPFHGLEDGIADYVRTYLATPDPYR